MKYCNISSCIGKLCGLVEFTSYTTINYNNYNILPIPKLPSNNSYGINIYENPALLINLSLSGE